MIVIHHDPCPDGTEEQMPETGVTIPSHASAMGKVLLAYDAAHAADALSRPLVALGQGPASPSACATEFEQVRRDALRVRGRAVIGESSVAAPICSDEGRGDRGDRGRHAGERVAAVGGQSLNDLGAARNVSRELGAPA